LHAEQELLALPGHLFSPPVSSGVRVASSLVFCVMFCLFQLAIVLFVLLRIKDSDYHFGIFKPFLQDTTHKTKDSATRITINTGGGGELGCSSKVSSSCSSSESHRVGVNDTNIT
jgi:hypothetical protein